MNTGTWLSLISTSTAPFTVSAAFWTDAAGYIVHWEIREQMTEADVEIVLQRAKKKFPEARPRIISDNGPQFIAKDFKEFIRISGMTHVKTSPLYPQSNGKLERFHQTIKDECIRPSVMLSLDDAKRIVGTYIQHYNTIRLHSAIGYVTPADKLNGQDQEILKERDTKLETARELRKQKLQEPFCNSNVSYLLNL
jgi:putative transposase